MICSWYFASVFCFIQQCFPPIITVAPPPIAYDQRATATAYTLSVDETDDTPCIGAGNNNLCEIRDKEPEKCIVATRLYPLNTMLEIEGFGECEVLDRTARKYSDRIDILMYTKKEAFKFGKREISYKLLD